MRINYNKRFDIAYPGRTQGLGAGAPSVKALVNNSSGALEEWTLVAPATPAANSIYSFSVDGTLIQFETGASTTQAQLVEGLNLAFRSNMVAGSKIDLEIDGTNLKFTAKSYEDRRTVLAVAGTGLTSSRTVDTSIPEDVPYGVIVVRSPNDPPQTAKLPTGAADETVVGITLAPYDNEWDSLDPNAVPGYRYGQPMDVLDRCVGYDGIWTQTNELDLTENDVPHYSTAAGTRGRLTKSTVDAVSLAAVASIQEKTAKYNGENYITLLRLNLI